MLSCKGKKDLPMAKNKVESSSLAKIWDATKQRMREAHARVICIMILNIIHMHYI